MINDEAGFRELEHTADLAIQVWAPDLPALFVQAAVGMNVLAEIKINSGEKILKRIEIDANDNETLLVNFLSEILYFGEQEEIGFDEIELMIGQGKLIAICSGGRFLSRDKAIKAVTFHQLEITQKENLYQVEIVFDV